MQDIQALLKQVTSAVLQQWSKADKAKGKTGGVNAAFITALKADVAALAKTKKRSTVDATAKEAAARAPLRAELQAIRDDVAEVFPDDVPLKRAYGTGAALSANSSNQLLKAANDVISAFAQSGKKVAAAGLNARRITALEKLRDTLSAADTGQREAAAQKKGATADGTTLRKSIDKRVSLLRAKLAKTVSKSASGSTARRHAVTPRAKTPLGIAT